jgi:hypothetical protein
MKMPILLTVLLFIASSVLSAGEKNRPNDGRKHLIKTAKQLIIPEVLFRDNSFYDAIDFIRSKAKWLNIVVVPDEYIDEVEVNLELRNITLYDAIRYLVEVSHLDVRVDENAVVIFVDEEEWWDEEECEEECDEEEDWEEEEEED